VMRSSRDSAGWVFRVAAAIGAAALMDPVVEFLSNAGAFGAHRYTDRSNLDVVPALLTGLVFSAVFVAVLARRRLNGSMYPIRWVRRCAGDVGSTSLLRILPSIFALQMGALFGMETLEQILTAGHPLGSTIWLGGPIAVSLLLHALSCITVTCVLSCVLHFAARSIVRAFHNALEFLHRARVQKPLQNALTLQSTYRTPIEPFLRRLLGRAPPALSLSNS